MQLFNVFEKEMSDALIARINQLSASTTPQWGKMTVAQMLAHCSVAYEMALENNHKAPNFFMKFILTTFVKKGITDATTPYKKNSPTAPAFIIQEEKDFEAEKKRLIAYIEQVQGLGEKHFEGKASLSFGALSATEWSNLFSKHLDHHLTQFGV
jgi:hypothetical protein